MPVPFADIASAIAETEPQWRGHLSELHARSSYILGAQVEAFEKEFAAATGASHAIGVGSGCSAIEICLRAVDVVRERQLVLTTALSAPFTAVAVQAAGATPVFADIDPATLLIDPEDAAARMSRKVAAILPVHLYGQICRIEEFARLARSWRVPLIQDACQAHGAAPFTSYSPYVAYSFYPTKNLGALGDGGAVTTNSVAAARRIREIRDGGRRGGQVSFIRGINSRLDEMQACYLRAFLTRLTKWNARRVAIAERYDAQLANSETIIPVSRTRASVCHLYVILAKRRDKLRAWLTQRGIATGIHYPLPLHLHPAFQGKAKRGSFPNAERACRRMLSLPLHPFLSNDQVDEVAETIRKFYS